LLIWHSKYSAILSKIHRNKKSYRLLVRRFCPLGMCKKLTRRVISPQVTEKQTSKIY